MIRTIEATIDEQGNVKLLGSLHLRSARQARVTILEDPPAVPVNETANLSEAALAEDWNRPEEETAGLTCSRLGSACSLFFSANSCIQ